MSQAAAEAKAAEMEAQLARLLSQTAERNVDLSAQKASSEAAAAEAQAAKAVAQMAAAEATRSLLSAESVAAAAVEALRLERSRAAGAEEELSRELSASMARMAQAESAQAEMARETRVGWLELGELREHAVLKSKQADTLMAELRSREEAARPAGGLSGLFGSGAGAGPVRSREKFERQLVLTQQLEQIILAKDQEILRLQRA